MRRRLVAILSLAVFGAAALATAPGAQADECEPKASCFGLESVDASLSTHQAGAHPDLTFSFALKLDPESEPNHLGLHESYAPVRDVKIELPPGLVGNPNVLGASQQCPVAEFAKAALAECPNGSQIGTTKVYLHGYDFTVTEPLYMMAPPGGDVVARVGFIAGLYATFIDFKVRSEGDYGLTAEVNGTSPLGGFIQVDTTTWGVPAAKEHDNERCTPYEAVFGFCTESPSHPPGSLPVAFMTNPTRCGTPLSLTVSVDSWGEPGRFVSKSGEFPTITGCDKLPFNPSLFVEPTSPRAAGPTGLELSYRLPAPEGVGVLESSQLRDLKIDFPPGMGINSASADGLATCSPEQVGFGNAEQSHCPNAAKLGDTEFDIPALPRRMKGSIYLREPEPGHLFRIWVVADDLGAHVKLPGELEIDEGTGQIHSVVLELPQVPVREVRLLLKSGFRASLVNPQSCGTYQTHWEFNPWSGTGVVEGDTPMSVNEACETGGYSPRLQAGSTNATAGAFSPFAFAITRADSEENTKALGVSLPQGISASFAGVARCEGQAAETGNCPAASKVGRVIAASGAGPKPLWVPQPGKDPTAVYLGGPYKGAPLSVIAVVPAQAGPFDLGDVVVRSAVFVDPVTAQATALSDPIPQLIQGVPVPTQVIEVLLDRERFSLNPTSCAQKQTTGQLTSAGGKSASPTAPYWANGCASLGFAPSFTARIFGPTHRGFHPRFRTVVKVPGGGANLSGVQVTLPHSEFLDNAHLVNVCTRVQFKAKQCPPGATIGHVTAISPLFDFPLEGDVVLRTNPDRKLPDAVLTLHGPASLPIEVEAAGHVDSVKGALRTTFEGIPDAPVSEVVVELAGGAKGLLQNTEGVCEAGNHLTVAFSAQSGRRLALKPKLQADCKKTQPRKRKHKRH